MWSSSTSLSNGYYHEPILFIQCKVISNHRINNYYYYCSGNFLTLQIAGGSSESYRQYARFSFKFITNLAPSSENTANCFAYLGMWLEYPWHTSAKSNQTKLRVILILTPKLTNTITRDQWLVRALNSNHHLLRKWWIGLGLGF